MGAAATMIVGCGRDVGASRLAQRPDTEGTTELPPVFGPDDVVETHDSAGGRFRVHFTRAGQHAVPLDDDDGDGTPDYVQRVGEEYERVLTFFVDELGYAPPIDDALVPDNGGDARFDVYLLDFASGANGAFRRDECLPAAPTRCPGHMVQENDFDRRGFPSLDAAIRILASHELFHAVQAGYAAEAGAVVGEGTAVWASETYDPTLRDFEGFLAGYFERTERSLGQEPTGPVDPFSYGSAIFFRFLEERFDREVIRELLETPPDAPDGSLDWLAALEAPLAARGSSFADAFAEFALWNLYTAYRADPAVAYAEGAAYPTVAERDATLPYQDDLVRVFPASARYYAVTPGPRTRIAVALVAEDPADLEGVRLALASEVGAAIDEVRTGSEPTLEIPSSGIERVHVALIGAHRTDGSRRVGLCIGAPDEVEDCRAALLPSPDAGVAMSDAGVAPVDGGSAPPSSGGCRAAPGGPAGWAWLVALAAVTALRRRRR